MISPLSYKRQQQLFYFPAITPKSHNSSSFVLNVYGSTQQKVKRPELPLQKTRFNVYFAIDKRQYEPEVVAGGGIGLCNHWYCGMPSSPSLL